MSVTNTDIDGCYILRHDKSIDSRGEFCRVSCCEELMDSGIEFSAFQISIARNNKRGTIRGMHYQSYPFGESKIISCIAGSALLVIVDMRGESKTFLSKCILTTGASGDESEAVYVPKYCSVGYQTIEDDTTILYMIDEAYKVSHSVGINYLDEKLSIPWLPIEVTISEKDKGLPRI